MNGPASTLDLAPEDPVAGHAAAPWLVLVADDDPEVHAVTRLAIGELRFDGRPLQILSAASAAEARELLARHPGIALILLDVVMESEHAGLDLVRHVRETMGNTTVRIVLRTGQPGQAPPREVVTRYGIDDYRAKTELTYDRLFIVVVTALRTYRLLHELALRSRQLAESNEDLERFAYVASHDLQTPLRGIISFAQLLQRRTAGQLDAESANLLEFVLKGGRELHLLVTDLLDFSRVGRGEPPRDGVDLNHVLAAALDKMRVLIEARHADVQVGTLPVVHGNPVELEQLFRNLLENGIKFQPGEAPRVAIEARADGPWWEIRVSDHGVGIESAYLETVFDVFHRLHPQDLFPGSGIGLAICRKVAQRHGGTIHAESVAGKGTTMVVRLPLQPPSG